MALSLQEKIDAVEKACCAAAWRKADVIIEDRPGWFRTITPSTPLEAYNGVHYSVLKETEADSRIQAVIEDYRRRGASFRWIVGPGSRPGNLANLLHAHGMTLTHEMLGMVAEVAQLSPSTEAGISVEEVTPATVGDYARACVAGWGQPPGNGALIESEMRRSYATGDRSKLYYIARYQGQAAGTGVLMPLEKSAYLMASSVDPRFRGKGVYRGLVARRLEVLRERGIPLVTIQAIADTSAPICKKLGFETVCQLAMYGWEPQTSLSKV